MINSELLKEAIADAKAVRATALANAKAALEEAFAPRFEAMFADKLKEEAEEEEDEGLQEVEAPNQVQSAGGEAKGPSTKPVTKGQPTTKKKSGKDFTPVQAGEGPTGIKKLNQPIMETSEEEEGEEEEGMEEGKIPPQLAPYVKKKKGRKEEEGEEEEDEGKKKMDEEAEEEEDEAKKRMDEEGEEEEEEDEGKVEEAGLTSEDLDEIIAELENEVAEEEEGGREEPPVAAAEEEPPVSDEVPPTPEEPAPDVDVTAEPGSDIDIDLGPEGAKGKGIDAGGPAIAPPEGGEEEEAEEGEEEDEGYGEEEEGKRITGYGEEDEENINLDELLAALNEEAEEEEDESEEMDEALQNQGVPTNVGGQDKGGGVMGYPKGPDASKKQLMGKNHIIAGKGNIGKPEGVGKPMTEAGQYRTALKEAYKTIEFLRGQINEVNLLNAKLLYTNKLFKEFAGVLDDSYRMKIVESFDLTKSVREVKLAYALLAESLNFGTQITKTKIAKAVAKPAVQKGQVKQITEGFASRPVSSTKPSQLITEGNEMALRFKKLAGIKDTPKTVTS